MQPARHIPLSPEEFATLGEITAILGIIDDEMISLVGTLLSVDRAAANQIMGSTRVSENAKTWGAVINSRCEDPKVLWLVKHAQAEMKEVSSGRNDFIHAVFERPTVFRGGMMIGFGIGFGFPQAHAGPAVARRVKSGSPVPVAQLPVLRDRAARLSCLVCYIGHIATGNTPESSQWHNALSPTLPPWPEDRGVKKNGGGTKQPRPSG